MKYDAKKVIRKQCPKCGAAIGEWCQTKNGTKTHELHAVRKALTYPEYAKDSQGRKRIGVHHYEKF